MVLALDTRVLSILFSMLLIYVYIDKNQSENMLVNNLIKTLGFFSVVFHIHKKIHTKHKTYEPQFVLQ